MYLLKWYHKIFFWTFSLSQSLLKPALLGVLVPDLHPRRSQKACLSLVASQISVITSSDQQKLGDSGMLKPRENSLDWFSGGGTIKSMKSTEFEQTKLSCLRYFLKNEDITVVGYHQTPRTMNVNLKARILFYFYLMFVFYRMVVKNKKISRFDTDLSWTLYIGKTHAHTHARTYKLSLNEQVAFRRTTTSHRYYCCLVVVFYLRRPRCRSLPLGLPAPPLSFGEIDSLLPLALSSITGTSSCCCVENSPFAAPPSVPGNRDTLSGVVVVVVVEDSS